MEEEKLSERHNSLWAFLGTSHTYKHFLGKLSSRKSFNIFGNLGFTLVELIVVIAILAVLIIISIAVLNPVSQLQKAKDAIRQSDLNQLYTALDTFYNDKGCYPTKTDLSELTDAPIYIKKIPVDPDAASNVKYNYFHDPADCPQWFTIITREYKPSGSSSCPLEQLNNCLPTYYTSSGYNTCKISGNIDSAACSFLITQPLPVLAPILTPIPSIPDIPTPTPTPTIPVYCSTYFAQSQGPNQACQNLGSDSTQCTIHNPQGNYVCWSAGLIGNNPACTGSPCTGGP
jgi:prepilin-type N-terminal cleavage/methylation domain-containing protein